MSAHETHERTQIIYLRALFIRPNHFVYSLMKSVFWSLVPRPLVSVLFLGLLCLVPARSFADTTVNAQTVGSNQTLAVENSGTISTSGAVEVQSGGTVLFRAQGAISLQPGFKAIAGSFFHASITQSYTVPLAWVASAGATSYKIYRNGTLIATVTTLDYLDTTALAGTLSAYEIKAVINGNETLIATFNVTAAASFEVFTPVVR
jgi:hypothetical protein